MTSAVLLVLAVFAASAVEMVEALTIVVASGTTRGWRSAIEGSIAAVVVLGAIVGAVGVPLIHAVPINVLRVVIGGLLLVLGLGWLRKAILRASGHKDPHDEDLIYARTVEKLRAAGSSGPVPLGVVRDASGSGDAGPWHSQRRDSVGFVVAFKGVFLEGMEVVLIALSLGSSSHRLGLAAIAAGAAVIIVGAIGIAVARQLSEVPENAMKMTVGIMLTSFGVFWAGEGAGVAWPGRDLSILWLIALFGATAAVGIAAMRRARPAAIAGLPATAGATSSIGQQATGPAAASGS